MIDKVLPSQYLHDELDEAIVYFANQGKRAIAVKRNGAGEFTVTFTKEGNN